MLVRLLTLIVIINSVVYARRSGGYSKGYGHYPSSHGYSGTGTGGAHSYPHSTGLSGNTQQARTSSYQDHTHGTFNAHKTEVHHHYHYSPPQYISYGSTNHPVYHSSPPVYVYEYRDSGSRFDNLLTGLALYNLGRMSASHGDNSHNEYRRIPGEICKLGISKTNGEYEETRIDCKLMSSFIWEAERDRNLMENKKTNSVTTVNITQTAINSNNTITKIVTVQNTTVVDALQVKGPSLKVTTGMNCFMIRISADSSILRKKVECGLLQTYAQNSLRFNGCGQNTFDISNFSIILFIHFCIRIYA